MTSPVRIRQRRRGKWQRPISGIDLERACACCSDPQFLEALAEARLNVQLTPDAIPGRDMAETLAQLAARLDAAARALEGLPLYARARLYGVARGGLPVPDSATGVLTETLALQLDMAALVARTAATRVRKAPGRPADARILAAVSRARALCKRFSIGAAKGVEIAAIILESDISVDAYRRAAAHTRRRKPT
jgi:hypothetical protein